jgi:phosphate transport system substrate-binding protein
MAKVGRNVASVLLALAVLTGCGQTPVVTRTPVTFELAVSLAAEPLMDELTAAYRATRPHILFNVRASNSQQAMEALWNGDVDLAAVSWLTDADRQSLWVTPFAIGGVAIVVHPTNPINNFSLLQLRDIFRGRTDDWSEAGGPNGEISVISRESGSGVRAKFEETVMEGRNVTVNAVMASSERAAVDSVQSVTTSIGYLSTGYITNTVKVVAVEGIQPSPATLANQSYALSLPMFFATPEEPQGELRAFVAWVLGPEAQAIVGRKYGRVK